LKSEEEVFNGDVAGWQCIGWKSRGGKWSLTELSMKGKKEKGGRVMKKERDSRPHLRSRVNLGRAAAVHCFSGCDSGELEPNLQAPADFTKGGSGLEIKESLKIRDLLPFAASHSKVVKASD
jgi:hypothetical protein